MSLDSLDPVSQKIGDFKNKKMAAAVAIWKIEKLNISALDRPVLKKLAW